MQDTLASRPHATAAARRQLIHHSGRPYAPTHWTIAIATAPGTTLPAPGSTPHTAPPSSGIARPSEKKQNVPPALAKIDSPSIATVGLADPKGGYTSEDIRYTQSKDGKTIYAIALGRPNASGKMVLTSFATYKTD
jgi:hypothetical protein